MLRRRIHWGAFIAVDVALPYVEFTLEPDGNGSVLRVTETGFAQLPLDTRRETYDSHRDGWARELAELVQHLNGN